MSQTVKKIGSLRLEEAAKVFRNEYQDLIDMLAENTLNHFLDGFNKGAQKGGGQTNDSLIGWKRRKNETKRSRTKSILNSTGALFRDIKVIKAKKSEIIIGTTRIPYARVHNEGLRVPERRPKRGKVLKFEIGGETIFAKKAAAFKMPKREFIGESKELDRQNDLILKRFLNHVFKGGKNAKFKKSAIPIS